VTAVALALVVLMLSLNVRSSVAVLIETSPEAQIPVGLTVPMVSALESRYVTDVARADDEPAAIVATLFDVLASVKAPAPFKARPLPVIAAVCVTAPEALSVTVLAVAVTAALMAMSLPCTATGPAITALVATVMSAVLPDLPRVRLVKVFPNTNPVVENELVKLVDVVEQIRRCRSADHRADVDGASFCKTSVPPLIVVTPAYVPFAVSVRVFVPDFVTAPVPEIDPPKLTESLRSKRSVALFVTFPEIAPTVPPAPTLRVPAVIVVPPEYVLAPVRLTFCAASLVSEPVPEITPEYEKSAVRL
jgi:hypothetical protein